MKFPRGNPLIAPGGYLDTYLDSVGHDPHCSVADVNHICTRRDGRVVRNGQDDCYESAAKQVTRDAVCAYCGQGARSAWNARLMPIPGGGVAHPGCVDDETWDRFLEQGS